MQIHYSDLRPKVHDKSVLCYDILVPPQTANGNVGLRLFDVGTGARIQVKGDCERLYYLLSGRGSVCISKIEGESRHVIDPDSSVWLPTGTIHEILNSGEGPFRCLEAYSKADGNLAKGKMKIVRSHETKMIELVGFLSRAILDEVELKSRGAQRIIGADLETITPACLLSTHEHEEEIVFVLRGNGFVRIDRKDFPVRPGSMVYTGPHVPHSVHNTQKDDNLQYLVYEFSP